MIPLYVVIAVLKWLSTFAFILGKIAVEGKVEHKFDMKPHGTNFEEYGKMCRERTNKSMIKNRQIQVAISSICFSYGSLFLSLSRSYFLFSLAGLKVIDNDRGVHMRPMPGMIGLISTNAKVSTSFTPFSFCTH